MIGNTKIALIVVVAENNAIGKNGNLLIHLSADLKWFKKNTVGHTVIMGRKTFETLPNGALPNRKNIILSKNTNFIAENCIVVSSLEQVEKYVDTEELCFVIGGAEIYKLFLPFADKLYITKIHSSFDADTYFPKLDFSEWKEIEKTENKADEKNLVDFDFLIYNRITKID